ncbi:MAG: DNA cytosine methyltransferase [Oligoflexia bacterium]|nr:DNA cytosine methyltransferase [Oligoflexia bacterium]
MSKKIKPSLSKKSSEESSTESSKENSAKSSQFNFIDLFCGAGGLSLGLEMAGLKNIFSNDVDVNSINTIRANYPDTVAVCEPIEFINEKKLKDYIGDKKVHLVAGGPPCQGFSTIGKGDPSDKKNSLFQHFVRVVEILRPEFVMFENVTGLVATKNENTVKSIIGAFGRIGYKLHIRILESQHYGVPQKRKRTLIVGCKKEYSFTFPRASYDTKHNNLYIPAKTLGGALLELENYLQENKQQKNKEYELHDVKAKHIKKQIDLDRLKHIPEGRYIRYKENEEELLPAHLRLGIDWENIKEGRLRENHYHRLSRNKPSPTINTHNFHYYHPTEHRQFTLRELSVIQSFPPNYTFCGTSEKAISMQIGNAVPPLMAKAVGEEIFKSLTIGNIQNHRIENVDHIDHINSIDDIDNIRYGAFTYDDRKTLTAHWKKRQEEIKAKKEKGKEKEI